MIILDLTLKVNKQNLAMKSKEINIYYFEDLCMCSHSIKLERNGAKIIDTLVTK